ncbi:MAG: Fe-S cluster biogenesis protein NfuA [Bradymonadia bacterium]|jgi:Fe-S cluster biogenesis protein NfuA
MSFYIHVQETPNPAAVKFISQYTVKNEGKSNYHEATEAEFNPLAVKLFGMNGVKTLFFFDNYITVTREAEADWNELAETILEMLQTELPNHNANYVDPVDESGASNVEVDDSPEVQAISEILDRTVRPYLQADGGGITVQKREGDRVFVRYEGACGSCPSSIGGTLMAIQGILRDELGGEIEVIETGTAGQMFAMW